MKGNHADREMYRQVMRLVELSRRVNVVIRKLNRNEI